jgi:quinoprotein glucose dehydrogenase
LKPPALVRQRFLESEISDVTIETKRFCSELFHSLQNHGIYTPFGLQMTLVVPGTLGGGNWSGASYDAASGRIFVNVNELGAIGALELQSEDAPEKYRRNSKGGEYARFWDDHEWPCQKPPWGTLNAIDVSSGEIVWTVPLGAVGGLPGKTGTPNLGGSIVTNELVFIGATTDKKFRAFDAKTGEELWSAELEASAHATPVTYLGRKSGKQFVAVAAGGGGFFAGSLSDVLAAYSLPDK